jgi:molybdopterin-guanine dinucleotide biosynthesis protein A
MPFSMMPMSALVLAGRRNDAGDPLDEVSGGHKAFLDIGGMAMIERVLGALGGVPAISERQIAAPADVRERLQGRAEDGPPIRFVETAGSPSRTVHQALKAAPAGSSLLVTTCDHALLTSEIIKAFLSQIDGDKYDAAAACVTRETYQAAYPDTNRTFVRLRGFEFSGANLFWFKVGTAEPLIEFWRRLEDNRKEPAKMAAEIGLITGAMYLAGWLTKAAALKRIEQKTGVRVGLIALPFAEAAIDVDKPADIKLVRAILSAGANSWD